MTWIGHCRAGYGEVCAVMCRLVRDLRDNPDFIRFGRGGAHAAHGECDCGSPWPAVGNLVQAEKLPTPSENDRADFDIDDHVGDDDDPDRCIKRGDSEGIPVCAYPAPELVMLEKAIGMDVRGLTLADP